MHFSSPSGHRLSWWRPWNRGAVGFFSNGYCSVTTFLNIVRNVTPKPAIGSQNCSLMPLGGCSATSRLLSGHRWNRVAAGERVEFRSLTVGRPRSGYLVVFLGLRDEPEDDEDDDGDGSGADQPLPVDAAVLE